MNDTRYILMNNWSYLKLFSISVILPLGCLMFSNAHAQLVSNPVQKNLAIRFMYYLEHKKIDSCLLVIEEGTTQTDQTRRNQFTSAAKEIEKVINNTNPSIILVGRDGKQLYRCRYYNPQDRYPDFFQADIYFRNPKADKIEKVIFSDRKTLIREQKLQQESINEVPPPPPVKPSMP